MEVSWTSNREALRLGMQSPVVSIGVHPGPKASSWSCPGIQVDAERALTHSPDQQGKEEQANPRLSLELPLTANRN